MIWMSDRWPPCILPGGLAKLHPVIVSSWHSHWRKKGSYFRRRSFKTMVQPSSRYAMFLYTCIHDVDITVFGSIATCIRVSYETSFHTIMWMPGYTCIQCAVILSYSLCIQTCVCLGCMFVCIFVAPVSLLVFLLREYASHDMGLTMELQTHCSSMV